MTRNNTYDVEDFIGRTMFIGNSNAVWTIRAVIPLFTGIGGQHPTLIFIVVKTVRRSHKIIQRTIEVRSNNVHGRLENEDLIVVIFKKPKLRIYLPVTHELSLMA